MTEQELQDREARATAARSEAEAKSAEMAGATPRRRAEMRADRLTDPNRPNRLGGPGPGDDRRFAVGAEVWVNDEAHPCDKVLVAVKGVKREVGGAVVAVGPATPPAAPDRREGEGGVVYSVETVDGKHAFDVREEALTDENPTTRAGRERRERRLAEREPGGGDSFRSPREPRPAAPEPATGRVFPESVPGFEDQLAGETDPADEPPPAEPAEAHPFREARPRTPPPQPEPPRSEPPKPPHRGRR